MREGGRKVGAEKEEKRGEKGGRKCKETKVK